MNNNGTSFEAKIIKTFNLKDAPIFDFIKKKIQLLRELKAQEDESFRRLIVLFQKLYGEKNIEREIELKSSRSKGTNTFLCTIYEYLYGVYSVLYLVGLIFLFEYLYVVVKNANIPQKSSDYTILWQYHHEQRISEIVQLFRNFHLEPPDFLFSIKNILVLSKKDEELMHQLASMRVEDIRILVRQLVSIQNDAAGFDIFTSLYETLVPKKIRHHLGEYNTPQFLANITIETAFNAWLSSVRGSEQIPMILDPSCGTGRFLVEAIKTITSTLRHQLADYLQAHKVSDFLRHFVGFELNPFSALLAWLNMVFLFFSDAMPFKERLLAEKSGVALQIPIFNVNALKEQTVFFEAFDLVIGNPPWLLWYELTETDEVDLSKLWSMYGLTATSHALKGQVLKGNLDFAAIFLYYVCDKYLKMGGFLSLVFPFKLLYLRSSSGFRKFMLPNSIPLGVYLIDDFRYVNPFGIGNYVGILHLKKGVTTVLEKVTYRMWKFTEESNHAPVKSHYRINLRGKLYKIAYTKRNVISQVPENIQSPWGFIESKNRSIFRKIMGTSQYKAQCGVHPGGASAIFLIDVLNYDKKKLTVTFRNKPVLGKYKVPPQTQCVREDFIYPVILGKNIYRWKIIVDTHILLPYHVANPPEIVSIPEIRSIDSDLYQYFEMFRKQLENRPKWKKRAKNLPFYTLFDVRANQWAPLKVVWRRMGKEIIAAVAHHSLQKNTHFFQKALIPFETVTYIPFMVDSQENLLHAHYLCAILNSNILNAYLQSFSHISRGFGSPGFLKTVHIPTFDNTHPIHLQLAEYSFKLHKMLQNVQSREDIRKYAISVQKVEKKIDVSVKNLYNEII